MNRKLAVRNEELITVYKYFSHHIRTSTSTIVAMMEAVKDDIGDDSGEMIELVAQSGFILDLFDRGMSATFRYLIESEIEQQESKINIKKLTEHLLERTCVLNEVPFLKLDINIDSDFDVESSAYLLKSIFLIIVYEAVKNASEKLTIVGKAPLLSLISENDFTAFPEIIHIFSEMLEKVGVKLSYGKNTISMRFD